MISSQGENTQPYPPDQSFIPTFILMANVQNPKNKAEKTSGKSLEKKPKSPKSSSTTGEKENPLVGALRRGAENLVSFTRGAISPAKAGGPGKNIRDFISRTTDALTEKTMETTQAVKLRMAILEIEHHLNRLYPDIGKTTYDLWASKQTPLLDNPDLKSKIEMVQTYRQRLDALKKELQKEESRPD
ncbi:MAG: hypothetical protein OEW12_01120 [Deltaproteobacteria bacterium]|nr:hypothetical protein [Deltaproteobacteria bacterium]